MVAFRNLETRPILGRGPSVLLRFVFFALLSFGLMWLDQRHSFLEGIRYAVSVVAYPFQVLVNSPGAAWDWLHESFETRARLQKENEELKLQLRAANLRGMRLEALEQENLRLRNMQKAATGIADRVLVAEIMRVDLNPQRHRVILNKGAKDGVFKGQPILDSTGVFGQVTRAGAFTSEAILISDFEHAIPVQVNRNGLRTIAVGTGDLSRLSLPFLPVTADIEKGDLLVTSGLGGVFPPGYPVATVTDVNSELAQTLATVTAKPAATLDRDREVLLVWVKQPPIDVDRPVEPAPSPPATPGQTPPAGTATPRQTQPAATTPTPTTRTPAAQGPSSTPAAQRPSSTTTTPGAQRPSSTTPEAGAPAQSAPRTPQPTPQAAPQPAPREAAPREETPATEPPATEPRADSTQEPVTPEPEATTPDSDTAEPEVSNEPPAAEPEQPPPEEST